MDDILLVRFGFCEWMILLMDEDEDEDHYYPIGSMYGIFTYIYDKKTNQM